MRRAGLVAAATLVAVAGLVITGRWEESRAVRIEREGLAQVRSGVSAPLGRPVFTTLDPSTDLACLLYAQDAQELCFDPATGRLTEAVDRTGGRVRIWSLRYDRSAGLPVMTPTELRRILEIYPPAPYSFQ